eukprot:8636525-Alexandrium_andersonii.AAC.1
MSASLVGSEMCIRDSANRARTGQLWGRDSSRLGALRSASEFPRETERACLLYTSDAADDM